MSFQTCLQRLIVYTTKAGLKISKEKLADFATQLDQLGAASMTRAEFSSAAQNLFDDQIKRIAAMNQADRLNSKAIILSHSRSVREGTLGGKDLVDNIRNVIHGGALNPSVGGRLDPQRIASTISKGIQNFWDQGIRPYKDIITRNQLVDEIFKEVNAINKGLSVGQSGSKEAVAIAQVIHATNNEIFDVKNSVNPFMERNDEFITNRIHNRERVSAVAKEEWVSDALASYGKKSFPEASPQEKTDIFGSIYDRIKDGSYGTIRDVEDSDKFIVGQTNSGNILRRMSRSRKLIADDWQAEANYFKKYGPETIGDLMGRVIDRTGKDVAQLSKWGSTPKANFDAFYNDVYARSSSIDQQALKSAKPELDGIFRQANGEADAPARNIQGKIARGLLNIEYAANTGMSYFRMLSDLGTAAGAVRSMTGDNLLGSSAAIVSEYGKAFASTEARLEGMKSLHIYATSARASIMGGLGSPGTDHLLLGNIAEKVGILGMHQRHVEAMKVATATVISREMAKMSDTSFEKLPARFQNGLLGYGIQKEEWDLLRGGVEEWSKQGALAGKYMTPDAMAALPDEAIVGYMHQKGLFEGGGEAAPSKQEIFLARKKVEFALGTLLNDHADYGSTSAGTRQKAFMYRGNDINDSWGIASRLFYQFKSQAFTTLDNYRRIYNAGGGSKGDWAGVAQTMAMTSFWWSVGEYAKQALEGKTPESPDPRENPTFLLKAFVASGGLGLAADIVQSAMRAEGVLGSANAAIAGVAGPAVSQAGEAIGLSKEYIQTAFQRYNGQYGSKFPNRQLMTFAQGNIPGANLFALKGALNYYVFNGMKEFLDVGYLGHLEQSVNKTPGLIEDRQRYFNFAPTDSPRWANDLFN